MKTLKIIETCILAVMMLCLLHIIKDDNTRKIQTPQVTISADYVIVISGNAPRATADDCETPQINGLKTIKSKSYDIPPYLGMKKWMGYRCFGKHTKQAKLQQYCITDSFGLRGVDGLYCIAIGSRFGAKIGQRIDLVLRNGTVIPCVMGDQKANIHTDATNTFSNMSHNLCCSEFIVDSSRLKREAAHRGDTSFICDIWQSPVEKIIVYDINILEELEAQRYVYEDHQS